MSNIELDVCFFEQDLIVICLLEEDRLWYESVSNIK